VNRTPELIAALDAMIEKAAPADLPSLCGQLEALRVKANMRAATFSQRSVASEAEDQLLDVSATAALLGMSSRWVRDHQDELPRVNLPGSAVRFSRKRLGNWIKNRSYG